MTTTTETTALTVNSLAATNGLTTQDDKAFAALTRKGDFLRRIQLYSKGTAINRRLVLPGQYGIPGSDDSVDVILGDSFDILILSRRAKAVNMSDPKNIVESFDPNSDVFKEIIATSEGKDSGCMYGVELLVYERTTQEFLTFFFGSKTMRGEVAKTFDFLPQPDKPLMPVTFTSRVIETDKYSWHAPVISPCSLPIDGMDMEQAMVEITKFKNPKPRAKAAEAATEEEAAGRTGRKR
jgi:hypothetical protein